MLRVEYARWGQSLEDLRHMSVGAGHERTRERFLALYEIALGSYPTQLAKRTSRHYQTLMRWVRKYNEHGPESQVFRHTGGPLFFFQKIQDAVCGEVKKAISSLASILSPGPTSLPGEDPVQVPAPHRWTVKRLVAWVYDEFGQRVCRETIRKALKRSGLSWKKAKKLLGKADPKKRANFLESLKLLLKDATWDEHLLVYIDEAHIHQDADLGYGWSIQGERLWVPSSSPGLSAKVSFYGLYLYNEGQVRILPYDRANGENTVDVLQRLRREFPDRKIKLVWDGAPYHRSLLVRHAALDLKIDLIPLPGYSPDFMPVESLWHWLREEVTYFFCHKTSKELIDRVAQFQEDINRTPCEIADRLWVKDSLDPEVEKLRIPR